MIVADNVTADITSSVLDRFIPRYELAAPPRPVSELLPERKIIQYPDLTAQTLAPVIIVTRDAEPFVGSGDISLPEMRNIGTVRLRVNKVSKLIPPDLW
ncbi:MAG: hypothetical protein DRR06_05795 [Gammaproteobacteria bacterium]|nr:MAG: hypothetical protein DRR06_05795 [Gammaproteobacteria bacterium]RLA49866.1 MAG: hypothetical protein DRR42_14640 [Gammaproteobacteria bacterium]